MSTQIHDLALNAPAQQMLAPIATTQTTTGTGIDLKDYEGNITVVQSIGVVGGTGGPTFTTVISESDDNSTFTNITGGSFTAVTTSGNVQTLSMQRTKRYVRHNITVAGTTSPTAPVSIVLLAQKKQV